MRVRARSCGLVAKGHAAGTSTNPSMRGTFKVRVRVRGRVRVTSAGSSRG